MPEIFGEFTEAAVLGWILLYSVWSKIYISALLYSLALISSASYVLFLSLTLVIWVINPLLTPPVADRLETYKSFFFFSFLSPAFHQIEQIQALPRRNLEARLLRRSGSNLSRSPPSSHMLSFHIQRKKKKKESEAKTNTCAAGRILKELTHFQPLYPPQSLCHSAPLQPRGSLVWHISNWYRPFHLNWTKVFRLHSVRGSLAECVFHSLPPRWKASDVCAGDQIKSAQLSVSAIRGGLWPLGSRWQAGKPNSAGSSSSPLIPADRVEWVWFTNRQHTSSGSVFGTTTVDLFTALICVPRWALPRVFALPPRLSFATFASLPETTLKRFFAQQESQYRTITWLCVWINRSLRSSERDFDP